MLRRTGSFWCRSLAALVIVGGAAGAVRSADGPEPALDQRGAAIFQRLCASCHGDSGQGVAGEYPRPLVGDKSLEKLTRLIERTMPDDDPKQCVGEDAAVVARYVHDAFYSPIAQARNRTARVELARLTVGQHRNAIADLIGGLRPVPDGGRDGRADIDSDTAHGLRGEYYNSRRVGRGAVVDRLDPEVRIAFSGASPAHEKLEPEGFTARWSGSLTAPETGEHRIIIRTDHAARLWLNDDDQTLIDAWVKSGDDTEHDASIFLIGGRAYPLRLEFTSRTQGVDKKKDETKPAEGFIELQWKLPGRVAEVVPSRYLSPRRTPEVFVVETPFPPDDRSVGYERGTSASKSWHDAAIAAAIETADHVVDHIDRLAGTRKGDSERDAKLRHFCARLVERAFRRPLSPEQRERFVDRQFAVAADGEAAVKRAVILALASPRFLYVDIGGETPDAYDISSRLSFALWDSLPDDDLLEAAASGRLLSRDEVARQAGRMIADPRARWKLREFLRHWLEIEHAPDLAKDGERYPGFDESIASDLRASLELFLDEVIDGDRADFRGLFRSDELWLNGRLARFYGFDLPADAPFRKIAADGDRSAGVLSHPYMLAKLSYPDSTSPIHRGVFLARNVLGRALRPPPEAFTPFSPDLHPELTTRERVMLQTSPTGCQSCHGMINSLGFTLERFDAVGRRRDEERGKPVDSSGSYELPSGELTTFAGPRELAEFLATSDQTSRAFVVRVFHHLVKQPILAYGVETPAELETAFADARFDMRQLMARVATSAALAGVDATADPPRPDQRRGRFARF